MSRSGFFDGLLVGTVLGAVFGMLYAPQSGEETRSHISKLKADNEDLIQDTKQKTEVLINKKKDAIEEGLDRLTKTIENKKREHTG